MKEQEMLAAIMSLEESVTTIRKVQNRIITERLGKMLEESWYAGSILIEISYDEINGACLTVCPTVNDEEYELQELMDECQEFLFDHIFVFGYHESRAQYDPGDKELHFSVTL